MHIVESTALTCGAKIDEPYIYKNFFPLPYEKYIVFAPQNKIPSKDYLYFQDVINCIFPRLENEGIKILYVGPKDGISYNGVINLNGRLTMSQVAYLIEKSMAFVGIDSFEAHVASVSNVPMICINSSTYANNTGPYFGDKSKQVIFESFTRTGNKKPSINVNEVPRCINLIKPEEIANAIFKAININYQVPFKTVFIGEKYSHFTIQEVLSDSKRPTFNADSMVEIRADIHFNESELPPILSHYKKVLLITNKSINIDILKAFKPHIQALGYKITSADGDFTFLEAVRELGIKIILVSSLPQDQINALKIKYYEFGAIVKLKEYAPEFINELKKDIDKLYYRSSKIISSQDKVFYSVAARKLDINLENNFEYQKVIDSPAFWENLDFFTLVKLIS